MNIKYIKGIVFVLGLFALTAFISGCVKLPASASSTKGTDVKGVQIAKSSDQAQAAEKKAAAEAKREAEKKAAREAKLKAKAEAKAKKEAEAKAKAELKKKAEAEKAAKAAAEKKDRPAAIARYKAKKQVVREARLKARATAKALAEVEAKTKAERKQRERQEKAVTAAAKKVAEAKAEAKKLAAVIAKAEQEKAEAEAKAKSTEKRLAALEAKLKARKKDQQVQFAKKQKAVAQARAAAVPMLPRGEWRFSAGVTYRTIHSQKMTTRSYSENYPISSKSRNSTTRYSPAGDTDSTADRDYIDGYVYRDEWTDFDGGTWYWGYDNSSQIQGETLSYQWIERNATEFSRSTSITPGEVGKNSDTEQGLLLQAERALIKTGWMDYGLHMDFSWLSFSSGGSLMTFRDVQNWAAYRYYMADTYSVAGLGITPSSTPYQGNYTDSGPTINNIPATRTSAGRNEVSSHSYEAYNQIDESLDMDLSTLSLGLTMSGNYRRLYLTGVTGPTLNIVETSASYHETLYQKSDGGTPSVLTAWNEQQDDSEYAVGFFVLGQVGVRIIGGLELGLFGRYDWLENISGDIGQSSYIVNPEGGSFGGTVNYAF